ncbi:hypothetical protein TCAL_12586 [Tigriopus californicus]|uniref:Large ribosomal subunit protein mL42 n=1 Tax=Tigriopus californicus TaxID=6832 RepID=A0A553P9V8_TIGCA|nr:large ribosomal subunit protein mL42-like [Tigriopus californicus]TRY74471.1 hypothetical protein TCAL_12586 [Tigriopus californicus]|eukprot:TCALIF_12586-PA protein Name:"Similar to MRPL42 39S ribosomal protein L42, mitochondrial (Bos taurus)" AED:0.00 eAED:0.00 QI:152/1/1/1/1/1/2/45/127
MLLYRTGRLWSLGVPSVRGLRGVPANTYRQERVTSNSDGSVLVCWHPEPRFPYALTRPMPRAQAPGTHSKLKIQSVEDMQELYHHKPARYQIRDLMRLTWTTKHRWFPNHAHRKEDAKKNPRERPYL